MRSASSSAMPSRSKIRALQLRLVDPDRARAELPAVEHEVVRLDAHRQRVGLELVDVVGVRPGERVVAGLRAARLLVDADEQREVDDPHVAVRALVHRRAAEVVAQRAEHLAGGRPLVGDDQQQVAGLGAERARRARPARRRTRNLATGESSAPSLADLHPHEALGAERLGAVGEAVELVAAVVVGRARHPDALDRAGAGERLELGGGEHRR